MCTAVCGQTPFSWSNSESEELAHVLCGLPGSLAFSNHLLPDDSFGRDRQNAGWCQTCVMIRIRVTRGLFGRSIGCFVAWYSNVCQYPSEWDVPPSVAELIKLLYCCDEDVLCSGIRYSLNSGLVVCEDGTVTHTTIQPLPQSFNLLRLHCSHTDEAACCCSTAC